MFGLLQFMLIADIAASLVSAPVLATGIGLGNGAGGTSFPQKTQVDANLSDREATLVLFQGVCAKEDWDKKKDGFAKGLPYPSSADDIKNIQANVDNIDWSRICPGNTTRGISVIGDAGTEMKFLMQNKWDRRVLYNLVYLYEKRFVSPSGAQVVCEKEGKSAPVMTIGVSFDALGNAHTNSSGSPVKPEGIDMEDDETASGNISPHAYFQALDIVTFSCTQILDDQGELQAIIPNSVASAQKMTFTSSSQAPMGATQAAATLGLGAQATKLAKEGEKPVASAFAGATEALVADGAGAILNLKGLKLPTGKLGDLAGAIGPNINFELSARLAEKRLGLPDLSISPDKDLSQSGAKILSKKMKIDVASAIKGGDGTFSNLMKGTSAFDLGIPEDAFSELKDGKVQEGLRLLAGDELAGKLETTLTSDERNKIKLSGILPDNLRSKITEVLGKQEPVLKKIYDSTKDYLGELDGLKKQSDLYKLADSLKSKSLTSDMIAEIAMFADPTKQDEILKKVSATNTDLAKALSAYKNANSEKIGELVDFARSYDSAPDRQAFVQNLTTSSDEKLFEEYFTTLPIEDRSILASLIGVEIPTGAQLKQALADGKFIKAAEIQSRISDFESSGLSYADAKELATTIEDDAKRATQLLADYKKLGAELNIKSYLDTSKRQQFLRDLSAAKISAVTGKTFKEVKDLLDSKDASKITDLVTNYSKIAGADAKQSIAFLTNNFDEFAKGGLDKQLETFGEGIKSITQTAGVSFETIKDLFSKADKDPSAKAELKNDLGKLGFDDKSAEQIAGGDFTNKIESMAAAGIATTKKISPQEALKLVQGKADKETGYNFSNNSINEAIKKQGYNFTIDTKTLAEGTDAQREQMAGDAGRAVADKQLNDFAASHNIPVGAIRTLLDQTTVDYAEKSLEGLANSISQKAKSYSEDDIKGALRAKDGVRLDEIARSLGKKDFGEFIKDTSGLDSKTNNTIAANWATDKNKAFKDLEAGAKQSEVSNEISSSIAGGDDKKKQETDTAIKEGRVTQLEKTATEKGYDSAAGMISDKSGGKISKDNARLMIDQLKKDPKLALDQVYSSYKDSYESAAAGKIASMTGGILNANQVTDIYKDLKGEGLTKDNLKDLGEQSIENITGVNINALGGLDKNITNIGKNAVKDTKQMLSTQALSMQAQAIGANVLLGSVGNEIAKIDPTGGLATGYLMGVAQQQLAMLVGGPALIAVALVLDPQAVISSVKGSIKMAAKLLTNPAGFISGIFGGGKPKANTPAENPDFDKENINKIAQNPPTASETPNAQAPSTGEEISSTPASDTTPGPESLASYSSVTSSYVPSEKFSESYLGQVALRTLDQITEDLLVLYGAQKSADKTIIDAVWKKYMGNIELPERSLMAKQIIIPRVLAGADDANIVSTYIDRMYSDEGKGNYLGLDSLTAQIKYIYGTDYSATDSFGRTPALSFSKKMNYVHISF